jgi:heterodisulfide reductase subunit B
MRDEIGKIALFRCCMTSMGLRQYEVASDTVLQVLGLRTMDLREFGCCGYPLRNLSFKAYLVSAARNLAIAEQHGTDILTFCNCCYGSLKRAEHVIRENEAVRAEINAVLQKEGLSISGTVKTRHFLEVVYNDIGVERLKKRVTKTFRGMKVATHYGCHLLRPRDILGLYSAFPPVQFDALVEATGAQSIPWMSKYECCGSPLLGVNDELSMDLTEKKLKNAAAAGADCLSVTCPYCLMQFDRMQKVILEQRDVHSKIPCLLFPQLIGLSLGVDPEALGLDRNVIPSEAENYLSDVACAG